MDSRLFKRYKRVIFLEILSGVFGFVGLLFGLFSILTLWLPEQGGHDINTKLNNIITYGWIGIDVISIIFGIIAILYSYRTRRKDIEDNSSNVRIAAKKSAMCDTYSIIAGFFGLLFSILSLIWYQLTPNTILSVITIMLDVVSVLFIIFSFHHLLTELWNGIKYLIKKTKTDEIIKARKVITKKVKKQFEHDLKENLKHELEEQIGQEIEKKKRKEIEQELKVDLEEKLKAKIIMDLGQQIESRIQREFEDKIEAQKKNQEELDKTLNEKEDTNEIK